MRPGEVLEDSFDRYPLPELLAGILRGNVSGRLSVFLHPEPRNNIGFRDGVPFWVDLPDSPVSVVSMLIEDGRLPRERGLDILRMAEASGRDEASLIMQSNLLSTGQLKQLQVRRARAQIVRLFESGNLEFSFSGSTSIPKNVSPTILQPLPIIYEGLLHCGEQAYYRSFLERHRSSYFTLSGTYPREVDPFEWGPQVEAAVTAAKPWSWPTLKDRGIRSKQAQAATYLLRLVDMVELVEAQSPVEPRSRPSEIKAETHRSDSISGPVSGGAQALSQSVTESGALASAPSPEGLVVHRRQVPPTSQTFETPFTMHAPEVELSGGGFAAPLELDDSRQSPGERHEAILETLQSRMKPFVGLSYYELLRVTPESDAAQCDRAYRFQLRRIEEGEDGPGKEAASALIREAYGLVSDPIRVSAYADAVRKGASGLAQRSAIEAEAKIGRAFRLLAEDRLAEVRFWLEWAKKLDPNREELQTYLRVVTASLFSAGARRSLFGEIRTALTRISRPDTNALLCRAWVEFELGEREALLRTLTEVPANHPLSQRIHRELYQSR